MKRLIYLQKIGEIDNVILSKLKKNLQWTFKKEITSVEISSDSILLEEKYYDSLKRQYNASQILRKINEHNKINSYFRILGVMDEDIYTRYLNFIFGIANLPKDQYTVTALISVTRLKEEFYRREEDQALMELRVLKEAVHELGHTFGLSHCENLCVMRFSYSLGDTDKKPASFCEDCSEELHFFLNSIKNLF